MSQPNMLPSKKEGNKLNLEQIMLELERRKVVFDRNNFLLIMWKEAIMELNSRKVPEPYSANIIVPEMEKRGLYVLDIADQLYTQYDRIIQLDFDEQLNT